MKLLAFSRTQAGHIFRACVEATESEIQAITVQPDHPVPLDGTEVSLFNLTKAYYRAEGRWRMAPRVGQEWQDMEAWDDRPQWVIAGYQNDDVGRVLDRLGLRPPINVQPGEIT